MKTMNIALVLSVVSLHLNMAAAQELFPLKALNLDTTSQQFISQFPDARIAFEKKTDGILVECSAFVLIQSNSFWNGSMVGIANGRVISIAYVQIEDFERGFSNAPVILRHLIRVEGTNYTRVVAHHNSKTGKVKSPVLLWEKPDRVIAYTFIPPETYKQGEPYVCYLTVFAKGEKREEFFEMATLPEVEKEKVFKSVDEIFKNEGLSRP